MKNFSYLTVIMGCLFGAMMLRQQHWNNNFSNLHFTHIFHHERAVQEPFPVAHTSLQARIMAQLDPAQAEHHLQMGQDSAYSLNQFQLCRLYWSQGESVLAVSTCQAGEVTAEYWIYQGLSAESENKVQQALSAFELAVAVDPDSAEAWFRLGQRQFREELYGESVYSFKEAILHGFDSRPVVYSELGRAHIALGEEESARDIFKQGILIFPDAPQLYLNLASSYHKQGLLVDADSWYEQYLVRWPESPVVWASRGEIALAQEQPEIAMSFYSQAIEYDAEVSDYWLGLARAASLMGDVAGASRAYLQLTQLEPAKITHLIESGEFFLKIGELDLARHVFEAAISQQPDNELVNDYLQELDTP